MKYSKNVIDMIVSVYGKQSEIYSVATNGDKVSVLVKADIKKKSRNAFKRIKDKKQLLRICLEEEKLQNETMQV